MYVEVIPNRSSPPAILLRESYRDGDKIRKRTLANLSSWPAAKIEALRRVLRNDPVAPMDPQRLRVVRSFPHGHVAAALGLLGKLRLDRILSQSGRQPARQVALTIAMIVARLIDPASKLATARSLDGETATCSLSEVLELGRVDEQELYAALDWLVEQQERIEQALADGICGRGRWFSTTSPRPISKAAPARLPDWGSTATASGESCRSCLGFCARLRDVRWRLRCSKAMSPIP